MNDKCECTNVKPLGNGIWQCIMGNCRRKFIPVDVCEFCEKAQAEKQEEVEHEHGA